MELVGFEDLLLGGCHVLPHADGETRDGASWLDPERSEKLISACEMQLELHALQEIMLIIWKWINAKGHVKLGGMTVDMYGSLFSN